MSVSEAPSGFEPAEVIDDGRTRMDPRAEAVLREYQAENNMGDNDNPALLHAFLESWLKDFETIADCLETLSKTMDGLSKKRGSFNRVLKMRSDDLKSLETTLQRISKAANNCYGDGKSLTQALLIIEGMK